MASRRQLVPSPASQYFPTFVALRQARQDFQEVTVMGWPINTTEHDMTCMKNIVFLNKINVKPLYLELSLFVTL